MGRPLRIEYPDAFYHITARGNERQNIFKSNRDRERFLGYLESASERYKAIIHTYSLMDNITVFCCKHRPETCLKLCITSMALIRIILM